MLKGASKKSSTWLEPLVSLLKLPGLDILLEFWRLGKKAWQRYATGSMYEVLAYEATLELLSRSGKKATIKKHKKIRYLQNNIIAYRDYAWGDGNILQSYRCMPGKPVDRYKLDYKTYILISLREMKNRGDIDEFDIQWKMTNGFLKTDESWTTDIGDRTKHIRVSVIFPKGRHPIKLSLVENNRRRTHELGSKFCKILSDGRLRVTWEKRNPRLHEHYVIKWTW